MTLTAFVEKKYYVKRYKLVALEIFDIFNVSHLILNQSKLEKRSKSWMNDI